MAAINDIRGRIDMLQITITKIYTATCSPVETAKNHIGIPNLPLLSMKEWNKWENFLSEEENKLLMVGLLAEHGKDDVKSSVYAIMRKILSNKVAMHFNLKGINREGTTVKKIKFQNTLSHGAII
ncbi:uncharacterized protein, partial [Mycetomoellerius zeteki]|uniref:uncharacterized protein n=1 Tax=Mycetomoellerius zeteki TaxID=64791 RepID=UPI00084E3F36